MAERESAGPFEIAYIFVAVIKYPRLYLRGLSRSLVDQSARPAPIIIRLFARSECPRRKAQITVSWFPCEGTPHNRNGDGSRRDVRVWFLGLQRRSTLP